MTQSLGVLSFTESRVEEKTVENEKGLKILKPSYDDGFWR